MSCKLSRRWRWNDVPPVPVTDPLRSWLTDRGSLTRRLRGICAAFRVVVHKSRVERVCPDEVLLLPVGNGALTMVREVSLVCDGVPLVFGHSILMTGKPGLLTQLFRRTGDNSLGTLLFACPAILRGSMYFKRIDRKHALYARCAAAFGDSATPFFWARRSVFSLRDEAMCVTEVFSPDAISRLREVSRALVP